MQMRAFPLAVGHNLYWHIHYVCFTVAALSQSAERRLAHLTPSQALVSTIGIDMSILLKLCLTDGRVKLTRDFCENDKIQYRFAILILRATARVGISARLDGARYHLQRSYGTLPSASLYRRSRTIKGSRALPISSVATQRFRPGNGLRLLRVVPLRRR